MAIAFTFKKHPLYVLLLMAGLALLFFIFHTLTGGRYASLPSKIFGELEPHDTVTLFVLGEKYPVTGKERAFLKNILVERGRDSLRLSEDLTLVINETPYALGIITSPAPLTFIKGPDGHLYLYRGNLLKDLRIPFQKEEQHEQ